MANTITDFLHNYKVRLMENLSPPVLTATVEGTAGSTSYSYKASFLTIVGESLACDTVTITNGNATLSGFNKVRLSLQDIPPSVRYIRFWKLVGQTWKRIADVAADPGQLYDTGQTTFTAALPTTNTSGRPDVIAICAKPGTLAQRISWMDLQSIMYRNAQKLWDGIHRDGDILYGCKEQIVTGPSRVDSTAYSLGDIIVVDPNSPFRFECTSAGTSASSDPGSWPTAVGQTKTDGDIEWTSICRWRFLPGRVYIFGVALDVPDGIVSLTAVGSEKIGLTITPAFTTPDEDIVQRAGIDEGVPQESANKGPDWLYLNLTWSVDQLGQVPIKEFLNGIPKLVTLPIERTELDIKLAERTKDVSGSFVVENFPMTVASYSSDATKLVLNVEGGDAYPNGFKVKTWATQPLIFNKARVTKSENNSSISPFSIPGGSVTTTNTENFNVDGLSIKLSVGEGNPHTVTFTGNGKTAAQMVTLVEAVNSYPTDVDYDLVYCTASAEGNFQIRATASKSLTIHSVTSDAYTILGISEGVYSPSGTRIYPINDTFVKTVSDLNYKTEVYEAVTHNGNTHIDSFDNTGVVSILGASSTLLDCNDHKWIYIEGVDFERVGNTISFAGMGGAEPLAGSTYYVCYQYNHNAVKGTRQLVRVIDAKIVKGALDGQDTITFTDATSVTRVYDGSAVAGLSGNVKDVVRILRVNNSAGQSQDQYNSYSLLSNSSALSHSNSQIDWSSAGDPNTGASGQPVYGVSYYVSFEYWRHVLEGDYLAADSYDLYEEIESYSTLNLRDCIDFRTTSIILPVSQEDTQLDYEYYLGRVDKLVLSDAGNFSLVSGTPSLSPVSPLDQAELLTMAILRIAPYTYGPEDVRVVSTEPTRITQRGIKELRDRIERLEYWKAVNDLEKEVAQNPAAVDSVGVFTDALTGFGRMDLEFNKNGVTHTAALDRFTRCLLLPATAEAKTITINDSGSSNVRRVGNMLMLEYTPEVFDYQPFATQSINCAGDFEYENYVGSATLNPPVDFFMDQNQLPALNADFDNNISPLLNALNPLLAANVNYGSWNTTGTWAGWLPYAEQVAIRGQSSSEEGFWGVGDPNHTTMGGRYLQRDTWTAQLLPGSIKRDLGNRVVDMTLVSMMRTLDENGDPMVIRVDVHELMPNQEHAVSIRDIAVDFTYDSSVDNPRGMAGSHTYQGKTVVKADNEGRLTGKFIMPSGVTIGAAPVCVFHYATPSVSNATVIYYGSGFTQNTQQTTIGINVPEVRENHVTQTQRTWDWTSWHPDPIAQTFVVKDEIQYISEIGLFFRSKHATLPITVQIRDTLQNEIPGNTVYASCTLEPEDVSISEDASVETIFELEHVVGYKPANAYALVVMPSQANTGYEAWTAKVGEIDVTDGTFVSTQVHDGVMFHSPNTRTWEPLMKQDLKMNLYRSNFRNDCQIVFNHITGIEASIIATAVEEFAAPGTAVKWSYSLDGTTWIPFRPDVDIILNDIITELDLRIDVTSLGGSYQMVERIAGIVFLLHDMEASAIFQDQIFEDELDYPNKIICFLDLDTDGTNGAGTRSVTPMYSWNDGESWVQLQAAVDYVSLAQDNPWYRYKFESPAQATISAASNASPIVVTATAHGFQENALIDVSAVGGNTNANSRWVATNVTDDTLELYAEAGEASSGNSAYTSGGVIDTAPMSQNRPRISLVTSHQARTPRVKNISFICSREG